MNSEMPADDTANEAISPIPDTITGIGDEMYEAMMRAKDDVLDESIDHEFIAEENCVFLYHRDEYYTLVFLDLISVQISLYPDYDMSSSIITTYLLLFKVKIEENPKMSGILLLPSFYTKVLGYDATIPQHTNTVILL